MISNAVKLDFTKIVYFYVTIETAIVIIPMQVKVPRMSNKERYFVSIS